MTDYQAIVDAMKTALAFSETTSPESIRMLARQYAEICEEFNKRMRFCGNILHQGNTSEAIRLAETEPNLLDLYNTLDFPGRAEWIDVVSTLAYTVPPPLLADIAQELNDTYNSQQTLEPYLKKYRLAALARVPLAKRLAILRQIAQLEPQNTNWARDQELLEKTRLAELDAEVKNAVKTNNQDKLLALKVECSQKWITPVPTAIIAKINKAVRKNHLAIVAKEMQYHAEQLVQAHHELNAGQGFTAGENIRILQEKNDFPVPTPIVEMTREALQWLQEERRKEQSRQKYEQALQEIQDLLPTDASQEELSRQYHILEIAAKDAMISIPEEVARAVDHEVDRIKLKQKRRTRLTVTVILFGCFVVTGIAALSVVVYARNKRVSDVIATLDVMQEKREPNAIRDYLGKKENDLHAMKNEAIDSRISNLKNIIQKDEQRHRSFEKILEQVHELVRNQNTSNKLPLEQLDQLAVTQQEKLAAAFARGEFQKIEILRQNQSDTAFLEKLSAVQKKIQEVARNESLSSQGSMNQYKELALELAAIQNGANDVGEIPKEKCRKMIDGLKEQIARLNSEISIQGSIATLKTLIGNPSLFKQRLDEIVQKFQKKDAAGHFESALREFPATEALLKYDFLRQQVSSFSAKNTDAPKQAAALALAFNESVARFDANTFDKVSPDFFSWIQSVALRPQTPAEEAELFANTKKLLTDITIKPAWPIYESPTEAWYYLLEKPESPGNYRYITSIYATPQQKYFNRSYFRNLPKVTPYEFARQKLTELDEITQENWTSTCMNTVCELIEADGIDPILKYNLLKAMITEFSNDDSVFAKYFQPMLYSLNNKDLDDDTNWMDPESSITQLHRAIAVSILQKLKIPDRKQIENDLKTLTDNGKRQLDQYLWIGFLNKTASGWICEHQLKENSEGELFIARQKDGMQESEEKKFELIRIGRVRSNDTMELFDNPRMLQGFPVFLKPSTR